ncbi:MAG TPA: ester cyclase [bacterium]
MSADSNKALVQRHFDEVLNACSLAAVDEIYSDGVVFHGPQGVICGRGAIKEWIGMMHYSFEGFCAEVGLMIAEEDRVVAKVTARAFHAKPFMGMPASLRHVVMPMTLIFRVENDKIAELENVYDSKGFSEDLGAPVPLMKKL